MRTDRDRDGAGRARNARPRDELGRPLARSASASPAARDVPRVPSDLVITGAKAAELGGSLLAQGHPFQAHEVFEAAWKSAPGPERELWRGLAQVAVGLTHARRGNARGAVALLRRGAGRVREYGPGTRTGVSGAPGPAAGLIDADYVAVTAGHLAERIERDGLAAVPGDALRISLQP